MTGPEDRKRVACGGHGALSPATIIPRAVLDACLPPAPGLDDHEEPTPGVLVLDGWGTDGVPLGFHKGGATREPIAHPRTTSESSARAEA
jgi:hypothetical protein